MSDPLWMLLNWMAETVTTSVYRNEWYYMLIEIESTADLLKQIGLQLLEIFSQ